MPISVKQALDLCGRPEGMDANETGQVLSLLVSAEPEESEGGRILWTWAERGETGIELAAAVRFLKDACVQVPIVKSCFDLCGTGGSGLTRFNVSTTVAFILAAAGVPVAKHGNKGSRRPNGSFDLLEALEVPFMLSPEKEAKLQAQTGLCFLFARTHHPMVGKVVPYRRAAGGRSIFNLAGPLANPATIKKQLIATIDEATARVVAEGLQELGTEGALIVWGEPGIDEISVTGATGYLQVKPTGIVAGQFNTPTYPGLDYAALPGGDAAANAETFLRLLRGEEKGPLLEMLCISAGVAIDLWNDRSPTYDGVGAGQARQLLQNGLALARFVEHRDLAQKFMAQT